MRFFKEMLAKSQDPQDTADAAEIEQGADFADPGAPDEAAWAAAEHASAPLDEPAEADGAAEPAVDPNGGDLDALRKALLELGDTEDDIDAYLAEGDDDSAQDDTPPIKSHFGRAMEQKNAHVAAASFDPVDDFAEPPVEDGAAFLAPEPEELDEEALELKRQEDKETAIHALRQMRSQPPTLQEVPAEEPAHEEPEVETSFEAPEETMAEMPEAAPQQQPSFAPEPVATMQPEPAFAPEPAPARKIWDIQDAAAHKPAAAPEPAAPAQAPAAVAPVAQPTPAPSPVADPAMAAAASAAARPARKAGRVKTRLLGFQPVDDLASDIFNTPGAEPRRGPAPSEDMFPVGWIVVAEGSGRGNAFTLFSGVSQIGRGEGQAVRLDFGDNSISRQNHAAVAYDDETGKFYLGHGGKSNIVRLNGKPVLSTEELGTNDTIRIGETTLRFVALCGEDFDWGAHSEGEAGHAATG